MTVTHDAIVIGARCGGAPTAMLLARKGQAGTLVIPDFFAPENVGRTMEAAR